MKRSAARLIVLAVQAQMLVIVAAAIAYVCALDRFSDLCTTVASGASSPVLVMAVIGTALIAVALLGFRTLRRNVRKPIAPTCEQTA